MGKSDNIKRAKRLKEAKRKREQDSLVAKELGPAGLVLKKRVASNGMELRINNGKIKYSEILKSFVEPIIEDEDPIDIIRSKYYFGVHAWNIAEMKDINEDLYLKARKDLEEIIDSDEMLGMFEAMIYRKVEEFSEYKIIISDFEIKRMKGSDYQLTVATMPAINKEILKMQGNKTSSF